jgi:hypothetical protein
MRTALARLRPYLQLTVSLILAALLSSCTGGGGIFTRYNADYLERRLALAFVSEGVISQDGERYDIRISNASGFTIDFLSGDATEGLVVEFFENGVFLFFDDLRFKTNSATFTSLEALKNAFELLADPAIDKREFSSVEVNGIELTEIGADTDAGSVRAFVSKRDGVLVRIHTTLGGTDIVYDVIRFENTRGAEGTTAAAPPPAAVVG